MINYYFIHGYVDRHFEDQTLRVASVLRKLIRIRPNMLTLSSKEFNRVDINEVI
jgi:hypothetical protein